ncbi:hypothetical protein HS088_TW06G00070 [Tripterygium wilfordii]|uniref:Pollen-specific LRR extensin-like protein n=1 Tax=Tripterygium wilfordii TaxID=458696 RepID=A0A7J7DHR4_TRIWF|nr:hypothetical protein HS088_TW06G00070 [Tripterygium wilfordii]
MGTESNPTSAPASATISTPTPSPSGKRSRDPEDEVYLDNLHSHKRYLTEIMASSLNGLSVGDTLPDNLMDSPARSESMFYLSNDTPLQYSPMSEDSDDSRFCDTPINTCSSQPDSLSSSPVSPYRYQRPLSGFPPTPSTSSYPSYSSTVPSVTGSQSRHRSSDTDGRFPSSPSDICHSADLRRAALLRSVQMRAQPSGPSSFESPFRSVPETVSNMEAEEQPCSFMKSLADEREYQIEECSSIDTSEPDFDKEKSCTTLNKCMKVDDAAAQMHQESG